MWVLWTISVAICSVAAKETVFLAPHSHCDAGWTSTFEEYYVQKVKRILDSVVDELSMSKEKVFNWAEIGYLARWWQDQDLGRQEKLKALVADGRIVWAGAGWVQHDEAVVHYRAAINQMTEGHSFLQRHFARNASLPSFGWQIDPFGHASANALIFALCGFSSTVTDRVSATIALSRVSTLSLEYVWQAPYPFNRTRDLVAETSIFAHELGLTLYMFPGFTWEASDAGSGSPPVTPNNVKYYRDLFAVEIATRGNAYATNNLLVPWGGDFLFYNGSQEWVNMDQIMLGETDAHYATISSYFRALHGANATWPVYVGDFFPYIYLPDTSWSGYFTSRAALKGSIRAFDALLETADTFFAFAIRTSNLTVFNVSNVFEQIRTARHYSGILCHHDAITGTARAYVVEDYFQMIANGTKNALGALSSSVSVLLGGCPVNANPPAKATVTNFVAVAGSSSVKRVRIPSGVVVATVGPNQGVPCQSLLDGSTLADAKVRAFSVQRFSVQACQSATLFKHTAGFEVSNRFYTLTFSETMWLSSVSDLSTNTTYRLGHSLGRYWSVGGSVYLFRADPGLRPVWGALFGPSVVSVGPLATEVSQNFVGKGTNISWVWRLYSDSPTIEIEYQYFEVLDGFDYVVRYSTNLSTGTNFFTDDMGWVEMPRAYNSSRPVEENYYPGVECISLKDSNSNAQFSVVTSQSHGVTSPLSGVLEIMMFRRLINPGFPPEGMGEALNDTTATRELHRLLFTAQAAPLIAETRIELANPPVIMYGPTKWMWPSSFEASVPNLPMFPLHILSFKLRDLESGFFMLRLQNWNTQLDVESFDLRSLFGIKNATPYGLSFLSDWESVQKNRMFFNNMSRPPRSTRPWHQANVEALMIRSYAVN